MKKARVIIPALSVLTLSMAAAVTSTVAWFTYVRDVNIATNPLAVINSNGNLLANVDNAKCIGCKNVAAGSPGKGYVPEIKYCTDPNGNGEQATQFRDASVDIGSATPAAFYPQTIINENQVKDYKKVTATDNTDGFKERDVYLANKYTVDFTLDRSLERRHFLFLNTAECTATTETTNESKVREALRVGVKVKTTTDSAAEGHWAVWAPFATIAAESNNDKYTGEGGSTGLEEKTIAEANIAKDVSLTTDYELAAAQELQTYLGYFSKGVDGTSDETISVDVYTWFEGSDPNCKTAELGTEAHDWVLNLEFSMVYETIEGSLNYA